MTITIVKRFIPIPGTNLLTPQKVELYKSILRDDGVSLIRRKYTLVTETYHLRYPPYMSPMATPAELAAGSISHEGYAVHAEMDDEHADLALLVRTGISSIHGWTSNLSTKEYRDVYDRHPPCYDQVMSPDRIRIDFTERRGCELLVKFYEMRESGWIRLEPREHDSRHSSPPIDLSHVVILTPSGDAAVKRWLERTMGVPPLQSVTPPKPPPTQRDTLITLRKLQGWRQNDVVRESGVKKQRYSEYEHNTPISKTDLPKLAAALDVDVSLLQRPTLAALSKACERVKMAVPPVKARRNSIVLERPTIPRSTRGGLSWRQIVHMFWYDVQNYIRRYGGEMTPEMIKFFADNNHKPGLSGSHIDS